MKAIIQRVDYATVCVDGELKGKTGEGFMVLLGAEAGDTEADADILARKVANLRIFCDENDKMNLSLLDIGGGALVISNFTLCADTKKGNRPSFINAMEPVSAEKLYDYFCERLKAEGVKCVEKGVFGGDMKVELLNNGPVTIILDTEIWRKQ